MQPTFFHAAVFVSVLVASAVAQAHDTWIMPSSFAPPAGQPIMATMSAGDGLIALSAPNQHRVHSVELIDAIRKQRFKTWKKQKTLTALSFGSPAAGVACLAVSTKEREIVIKAKLVDQYLAEIQPTADVTDTWARQRANGTPWKERYAKDAKTYLRTGDSDVGWPQLAVLGQVLEIVPQQNPTRLMKGGRFDVVLQLKGEPVADVALRLFSGTSDEKVVRTDAQGRASFELIHGGKSLIATTVLSLPAGERAPWTSRFATLGFSVGQ